MKTIATQERLTACRSIVDSAKNAALTLVEQERFATPELLFRFIREKQITALICNDSGDFNQVMMLLQHTPVRIPDDLSILSLGDSTGSFVIALTVTHVRLNHREVGETAGEVLIGLLNQTYTTPQQVLVPCEFVVGATTAVCQKSR